MKKSEAKLRTFSFLFSIHFLPSVVTMTTSVFPATAMFFPATFMFPAAVFFIMAPGMSTAGMVVTTAIICGTAATVIAPYLLMPVISSIAGVRYAVVIKVHIWSWFTTYYFITAVEVVAMTAGREVI
jgi:hypothetical protein